MPDIKNVEIFGVGTWKGFKFVQEDLKEITSNTQKLFEKGSTKPPIKLGHSTNQILKGQTDGDPSLGRVENFRLNSDKIVSDFMNIPTILYDVIKAGRFSQVSVELDHAKHFGWYITAVSLLGADLPAVKTLADLQAFLSEKPVDLGDQDVSIMLNNKLKFSQPLFLGEKEMADNTQKPDVQTPTVNVTLSQDTELKAKIKELEDALKARELEVAKMSEMESKIKTFQSKEIERAFTEKRNSILASYEEDVKSGKLTPAIRDEIGKHLDSQKANFSEKSELTISPELTRKVAESYTLKREETAGNDPGKQDYSDNPSEELKIKSLKLASAEGISYSEASEKVVEMEPELAKRYYTWTEQVHSGRI